jgi:hypothetical protein
MAHFAKLNDNDEVIEVIVVNNEELLIDGIEVEQKGIDFCENLFGGKWIQTSFNATFRKNYAGIGYTYDADRDAFISPKPSDDAVLDEITCRWVVSDVS